LSFFSKKKINRKKKTKKKRKKRNDSKLDKKKVPQVLRTLLFEQGNLVQTTSAWHLVVWRRKKWDSNPRYNKVCTLI
jgi:hypothetical protein